MSKCARAKWTDGVSCSGPDGFFQTGLLQPVRPYTRQLTNAYIYIFIELRQRGSTVVQVFYAPQIALTVSLCLHAQEWLVGLFPLLIISILSSIESALLDLNWLESVKILFSFEHSSLKLPDPFKTFSDNTHWPSIFFDQAFLVN